MHSKINPEDKGAECPGSELLHISKCSKLCVSIFKCVEEHNETQLAEYKEKHKPAHEQKVQSNKFVLKYLESKILNV